MDVHTREHPLDRAHAGNRALLGRYGARLPGGAKLSGRRLPPDGGVRHCRGNRHPLARRRHPPPFHDRHVHCPRHELGGHADRLSRIRVRARAPDPHQVRAPHQAHDQVRPRGGRPHQQDGRGAASAAARRRPRLYRCGGGGRDRGQGARRHRHHERGHARTCFGGGAQEL